MFATTMSMAQQNWTMKRCSEVAAGGEKISMPTFVEDNWMPAVVPGTVLDNLVRNGVYPEPYYGLNNKLETGLIPDISAVGRDFYTYWFRSPLAIPADYKGRNIWLKVEGINYRAEVWVNGHLLHTINGMFQDADINISEYVRPGEANALAIKVLPVDEPGTTMPKSWGAVGEFHNGGNGCIGLNTTMLMTVGWDFTFMDGIRDRNTGIWKNVSVYTTGSLALRHPFVRTELSHPKYDSARTTISVDLVNPSTDLRPATGVVQAEIVECEIKVEKGFSLLRGAEQTVTISPDEFPELTIKNPRLWWPVNKGAQDMYTLRLKIQRGWEACDSMEVKFGIREITSDQNTPDQSRRFLVNGRPIFIHGTNWIPEAMLRSDDARMEAELLMTRQSGVNLLRLWGGGIAESDRFYELCDSLGILVWQEFWLTGDTRHPQDASVYLSNVASTVKRLRNHPSLAYYVASNESSEVTGMQPLLKALDPTRGYQVQSECDGIHDGSPYKQVNPMQHYTNTASDRGSRIDGFNPEYGAPTTPLAESVLRMMPKDKAWPIDKDTWDYHDGNGFHLVTSLYTDMINCYGTPTSLEDYCRKGQLVGAMNAKSIWETWNYNKFGYGDRWCSGLLFWYHNCPVPQVAARMWDYYLVPTASLYHTANALEPIHAQFDYEKNTVSVVNDLPEGFTGEVKVTVYNLQSKVVWTKNVSVNVEPEGVANDIIKVEFSELLNDVHFIALEIMDAKKAHVSDNFYWRSMSKYEGKGTLTGPCTAGFESLQDMPKVTLKKKQTITRDENGTKVTIVISNPSSKISFFNQLRMVDEKGNSIVPAYYSDNFFTLLPKQSKTITIRTRLPFCNVELTGWNLDK